MIGEEWKGRTLSGLDAEHDLLVGEHARDRVESSREGLAEENHVGLDLVPVAAEHLAGSAESLIIKGEGSVLAYRCRRVQKGHDSQSGPRRR